MTHPPEPKEAEGLALWKIVLVGVTSLAVFAASILWAEAILGARPRLTNRAHEAGRAEVGIVNQWPFELDRRAEETRARDLHRLESWGWVDARAQRIHMPVEQAMDAVVAEESSK